MPEAVVVGLVCPEGWSFQPTGHVFKISWRLDGDIGNWPHSWPKPLFEVRRTDRLSAAHRCCCSRLFLLLLRCCLAHLNAGGMRLEMGKTGGEYLNSFWLISLALAGFEQLREPGMKISVRFGP